MKIFQVDVLKDGVKMYRFWVRDLSRFKSDRFTFIIRGLK